MSGSIGKIPLKGYISFKEDWGILWFLDKIWIDERYQELSLTEKITKPKWDYHVSWYKAETILTRVDKVRLENQMVEIQVIPILIRKSNYFFYKVESRQLEILRGKWDLPERPNFPFHLTIAKAVY